jgi:hypothetical protein
MEIRQLVFINADALPPMALVRADTESVEQILAWYGAYYAGDNYVASLDGVELALDHNGDLVGELPGA